MSKYAFFRIQKWGLPLLAVATGLYACTYSPGSQVSFNRDIRPILNANCLPCHGGVRKSGGFSLLFEEEAFAITESGKPAIIPGKPGRSEFIRRLRDPDPEIRMPHEDAPLPEAQIQLLEQWVAQGAQWETHWAYVLPDSAISPPTIPDDTWAQTEVDRFVLNRLRHDSLAPAPRAEKAVLLRRLSLDLIGLPPEPEWIEEALVDTGYNALESYIDTLLASPHFGEKWASMWLDFARYADSKGYEKDLNRSIWKYRDWVINAYNADLSFQDFTLQQLAGDLLPNPTESQLIATAFLRNSMANDEGGTDDEEFRVAAQIERVATVWETWMGTTMSCVQCHSHPYDPILHEDFYKFMAYLNNTADSDIYSEAPKLFQYPDSARSDAQEIVSWVQEQTGYHPKDTFLHEQAQILLEDMGIRKLEAEEYEYHSHLVELTPPEQHSVFQIQDSSWIAYSNIDFTGVEALSFHVSSKLAGGFIDILTDSLEGPHLGSTAVPITGDWKKWKTLKVPIEPIEGVHKLYLQFRMDEVPHQDLFRLDWIEFQEANPLWKAYSPVVEEKLLSLANLPAVTTPILQELGPGDTRQTHHFIRGNWLNPGDTVFPGLPEFMGVSRPENRLELAHWLASPQNPLAARVYVNRIWEQLFGRGLVETVEDFGTQGSPPSHPQLLDWLAVHFMKELQGSTKALLKLLVRSASYQQDSRVDPKLLQKDPANVWLARGPRVRLSAEQIRDQALAVSGLLEKHQYGAPVLLNHPDPRTYDPYRQATLIDYNPYRRSIYNFWKRTIPTTMLSTFDAPTRDVCVSRRIRTNTPLQALVSLNDSLFYEAAWTLAEKVVTVPGAVEEKIELAYERVMFRPISPRKLRLLDTLYKEALQSSPPKPKIYPASYRIGAKKLQQKEVQAMALVINALFNLDEFLTNN